MTPDAPPPLPFDVLADIDRVCTRFEQAWLRGPRPDLGDYLAGEGDVRRALFAELLKVDLEYRLKRGEQPAAADYTQRFPEEAGDVETLFANIFREQAIASMDGPGQSLSLLQPVPPPGAAADGAAPLTDALQRYRIERILGQGAFGVVYLARDRELDRFVALKVAHEARQLPGESDTFLAEARALASLDHPAVVPVYDVGRADGRTYIVTKWIEGSNLSERLRQGLPGYRQAAQWLHALALALQAAHDRGLVHRDVKPSNILLDAAGKAYVSDFGLALSGEQFGKGPRLLGTPAYMSPEQARGEGHRVDARSDIFSLGVVLYEMLTGRPPFQADSVSKTLRQVAHHEPVAPLRLNPTVGPDLDTICLKCLEKVPEDRYASAGALAEDLQRYLEHRSILARPAGPLGRLLRWGRREPRLAGALAAALGIFLAAFALVTWSYLRAARAFEEEARARQEAQRREQAERWERYRSNLVAAGSALQLHNITAARDALEEAPPEHRNWEWRHFHRQLDTADHVLSAPGGDRHCSFSADGSLAVLTCPERPPSLLDLRARQARGPLRLDSTPLDVGLSPDGGCLASCRPDGTLCLWDLAADRQRAVWQGPEEGIQHPTFSPDGTRLAVIGRDRSVYLLDGAAGKELLLLRGLPAVPGSLEFSPDGRRLAIADPGSPALRLWDLAEGQALTTLSDHQGAVRHAVFSPGGDRVLAAEGYPSNALRLWEAATGKLLAVLRGHDNEVLATTFSPDGARIATASYDQTVRLWDGHSGKSLATLAGHTGWVTHLAFSPDGKRLASASNDQTVRLWDVAAGTPLAILHGHTSYATGLRFGDGGATIVAAGADGSVRLWNTRRVEEGAVLRGHTNFVYDAAFHPDGRRLASAAWDGTVRLWDTATGAPLAVLRYPDPRTSVIGVAFHPGGKLMASVGRDDCVRLWNLDTGEAVGLLPLPPRGPAESRLAFSPRGDLLACGDGGRALQVWRLQQQAGIEDRVEGTEAALLRGHRSEVGAVTFGRDGAWLASADRAGRDTRVHIWELGRPEPIRLLEGHAGNVHALALSPDGSLLASGSTDGTVRLWDTATWQPAGVLTQGTPVYGVAFTPDGSRLAVACANNTIRLWDVATRQSVCDLHGHGAYVHQVAFSPDGTRLLSASGDFTLRLWDSLSTRERAASARAEAKR